MPLVAWNRIVLAAVASSSLVLLAACEDDLAAKASSPCFSEVSGYSSPAAGVLTLTGHFYNNESILVRDGNNMLLASGTPSTDRSAFTFTGVPSGSQQLAISVSCEGGTSVLTTQVYTIQ